MSVSHKQAKLRAIKAVATEKVSEGWEHRNEKDGDFRRIKHAARQASATTHTHRLLVGEVQHARVALRDVCTRPKGG